MRCVACDAALSDRESTTKFVFSGKYTDMCRRCLKTIEFDAPTEDSPIHASEGDDNADN